MWRLVSRRMIRGVTALEQVVDKWKGIDRPPRAKGKEAGYDETAVGKKRKCSR
jgi:hypothetical protein